MRVIAFFTVDGFYVRALAQTLPLTVVHHDKLVLDADDLARSRGVRVGMPLSEAKAILAREGHFCQWEEEAFHAAHRSWVDIATDITDALEPCGQHAAFLDLSGHPRPKEVAAHLSTALERFGRGVRFGLAASRWVAREAALRGDESEAALHIPKRFVARLPTPSLPLPDDVLKRLVLLGYGTVGAVARLNPDTLRSQFGEVGQEIHRLSQGGGSADVKAVFPANCLSERHCFEAAPETIAELEHGLGAVAKLLGNRLHQDDASAKAVELFLEHDDGSTDARRRTFSKAIGGAAILLSTLRLMLSSLPDRPIAAIRVRLPDIARSKRVQLGLDGERSRRDQKQSMEAALANARTAFGALSVVQGVDLIEPRYRKVRRAYTEVHGWRW